MKFTSEKTSSSSFVFSFLSSCQKTINSSLRSKSQVIIECHCVVRKFFHSSRFTNQSLSKSMTDCNQRTTDRKFEFNKPLPYCQVCGSEGAQTHYGGQCCVSCKMFFRRNSQFNLVSSNNK